MRTNADTSGITLWTCAVVAALLLTSAPALADTDATLERPDPDGTPTKVLFAAWILDVDTVNSARQSMFAGVFLRIRWKDPRLAHEGSGPTTKPLSAVWHPRVQLLNVRMAWPKLPQIVEIAPDGMVIYRQRWYGEFSAPSDVSDFPVDHHRFGVQFFAAGFGLDEVELVVEKGDRSSEVVLPFSVPDWKIAEWGVDDTPARLVKSFDPMPSATIWFEAHRRHGYYVITMLLSVAFIVGMSWLVVWIPTDQTGNRISVAVTSVLTLVAFRFLLADHLPRLSYLTRMDVFLLGAMVLVVGTLVATVITAHLAASDRLPGARKLDKRFRWVHPVLFAALAAWVVIH